MVGNAIEYNHVSKFYDNNAVLNSILLSIPSNETTAIVGESGSGKSTLLQMAMGLIKPSKGTISIFNAPIDYHRLEKLRRSMGYCVQGAGLFPHLSVFQNITIMASLNHWPTDEINARYHYLLDLLNVESNLGERFPYSLSGGQQQRVSLCRALMLNPQLLLLDEPFSALDPITREVIHREFQKLQTAEPRSIVLVTHDMSEAIKLAHQIVIVRKGSIEQVGSIGDIESNPASDYVEKLFAGVQI